MILLYHHKNSSLYIRSLNGLCGVAARTELVHHLMQQPSCQAGAVRLLAQGREVISTVVHAPRSSPAFGNCSSIGPGRRAVRRLKIGKADETSFKTKRWNDADDAPPRACGCSSRQTTDVSSAAGAKRHPPRPPILAHSTSSISARTAQLHTSRPAVSSLQRNVTSPAALPPLHSLPPPDTP